MGAADSRCSTIVKENKPKDCLDIGAASKWEVVVVVVREQVLHVDPITCRRSFAEQVYITDELDQFFAKAV